MTRDARSGLSVSSVAHLRTLGTRDEPRVGLWMNSFTVAVRSASCTSCVSSWNVSRKSSSRTSESSIRSAYWPMTQIIAAFASGSSSESKFSHSVEMMDSYWLGYFRKILRITTVASCTMYDTFVLTSCSSVLMQSCAAGAILMASLPMARTDFRTKSTSISVAYLPCIS
jgi:hypothetical protein